jgi:hypothetical protein
LLNIEFNFVENALARKINKFLFTRLIAFLTAQRYNEKEGAGAGFAGSCRLLQVFAGFCRKKTVICVSKICFKKNTSFLKFS